MSAVSGLVAPGPRAAGGGASARRAVVRWAWRLFRREWRQQLQVLALVSLAVAATFIIAAVAVNTPPPLDAGFGTAQNMATFSGSDPNLAAQFAELRQRFGPVDVIENQTVAIPGLDQTYDVRAQDPHGPYGGSMLDLVAGRYPTGPGEVALTPGVASALNLGIGDVWREGGQARRVVGIVQNPQSLLDEFALVAPGQVATPNRVTVLFDARGASPASVGSLARNVVPRPPSRPTNVFNPETIAIAGMTLGMLLIALVSIGGFTVLAQRRLRSLGMLASVGATEGNVGLVVRANGLVIGVVGSAVGTLLGFVLWLAYRPHLEASAHHLIGVFQLPWLVIVPAIVLGVAAAYFGASRPARAIARVPIVSALSGRPAPPRPVHRSAIPGIVFLVVAFLLLGYAGGSNGGVGSGAMLVLVFGLVALIPGVILLAPFFLSGLAKLGGRTPIAVRLALRDLARYRARAGSSLAAISLGVLLAVMVVILAAARYGNVLDYVGPNLASNQIVVDAPIGNGPTKGGPVGPPPPLSVSKAGSLASSVHAIATSLGTGTVVELEAVNATLQHAAPGRNWGGAIYLATPTLLHAFGINASQIDSTADILTARPGMSTISKLHLLFGDYPTFGAPVLGHYPCPTSGCLANPPIQEMPALPSGTAAPNTVMTERAVQQLHLSTRVQGWLIQTTTPLTATQINSARLTAAAAGMTIETRNDEPSSAEVINSATVFGIALALAILAMSVGLIRSETASDLRTLAATGAGSITGRILTATTAGGLALLGAVLGTVAAYVGVIGWLRSNSLNGGISALGNVPISNLLLILVGMPLVAALFGWLTAGREPPALARQPME